ncbi:apolipoprotein N-acyltransferase [Desulfohalovibrio reitneri]|uniref:apolipoprotein N-acyltransferase n=1 Tax=Desulfohalovibrio reitneri TaxID=1307759 RepID=UPI00054FF369|nr:apolipoprotein N-acyltransferase [Desulfohalovibrio reitneri]
MLFWAVLAVIGAWSGFANLWLHIPALGLLLPVGLAGAALRSPSPRKAAKCCFWTATAAYLGSLYWIALPVHDYGGLNWLLAAPCPVLVAMYLSLYAAVFGWVVHRFGSGGSAWRAGLLIGGAWACLEALRGVALTGFPWLTTSSGLAPWPWAIQAAAWIGGLGLGLVLTTAAAWLLFPGRGTASVRLAGAVVLAAVALFGADRLQDPLTPSARAEVALVQGNIDQGRKWDDKFIQGTVDRYISLSEEVLRGGAEAVIWPETALPFYYQEQSPLRRRVRSFARGEGIALLTGAPAYRMESSGEYTLFNRAYLVNGRNVFESAYDKVHLLPFGEYVPFGDYLPIDKLVQGVGDFAPGQRDDPLVSGDLAMGVLICYEAIFPDLAQERVAKGANLLVNISNDAWFGESSAPLQHLHLSLLRAVEQGRAMVRCTNTGISAFIDPRGRILESTGLFTATAISREMPLLRRTTFYHRHHEAFVWGVFLLTAAAALPGLLRRS